MNYNLNQRVSELNLSKEEDLEFEKSVSKFPSSFDLKLIPLTKSRIESIRVKLEEKLAKGFGLVEEEIRVCNLLSFLNFKLGDTDAALDYNSKALKRDGRNGIALANRARINRHQLNFYDADKDVELLEKLYAVDNALVTIKKLAEGEVAWSYARFGPKFHERALSKYETVLKGNPQVSRTFLILWKHDYGLCLRRTLHLYNKPEYPDRDSVHTLTVALGVLTDIVDTSHLQIYTARAWSEIGQLVYSIERLPETYDREVLECIPEQRRCKSSKCYFDRALELGCGDLDVMETCAKFYRYFDKFSLAIGLFEQVLQRRQTSFVYHHLALSIQKKEESKVKKRLKKDKKRQLKLLGITSAPAKKPCQSEETNLKRMIKCDREVVQLVFNEDIYKVLKYLENAVLLNEFNYCAAYDKALLLRKTHHTKEARVIFCDLRKKLELGELKISCFEQAGYCSLDLAKSSSDSEKHNYDAICCFQRAIELAAALAAKVKYTLLDVRSLIPTVKFMLTTPELIQTQDKKLQRLQNLLIQFGKLLPITAEVTSDSVKNINTLLEKCLQEERRDDAALLYILNEIVSEENEDTFREHLDGILTTASTSLSSGEHESAMMRYQIYFHLMGVRTRRESLDYDVFLMTDHEETVNLESMEMVTQWLKKVCGLRVINSDDHCFTGKQILDALVNFSQISTAVFVVLKDPKLEHMVKFFTTALISMDPSARPKLAILKDKSVELPLAWANVPTVILPRQKGSHTNSAISSWISTLF